MNQLDFSKLRSQINYSPSEIKIRKTPQYIELKNKLIGGVQVIKYQKDLLDVNLTSNFGEERTRQIKEPVCIIDCNHEIFDLYDIFFYQEQAACSTCKKQATKKNIKKEEYYSYIIKHMSEKSFSCSIIGQYFFHSFSEKIQSKARELLLKKEYKILLEQIIQNSNANKNQLKNTFLQLIDQKEKEHNQNNTINITKVLEFSFQCLINCQKIIIPIYLQQCKHLECYEFTNILQLIDDNLNLPRKFQRQSVKCFFQDCKTKIPLNITQLQQQLIFPFEIANAISRDYPFSLKLQWNFQQNQFQNQKAKVFVYLKNPSLQESLQKIKMEYDFLIILKQIINKELDNNLQNKLKFSKYSVSLQEIQFPCRCNYCELQNVKDIKQFIINYFIREKKDQFQCPACNFMHKKVQSLVEIIYFDRYLYQAQINAQDLQQLEYNKQDTKLFRFFLQHQQVDFQQVKKDYQQNKIYPYECSQCILNIKKKIKEPLTLIFCQQKRSIDFKSFKKFLEKNNFNLKNFPQCTCVFCNGKILNITDFYSDSVFKELLSKELDPAKEEYIKQYLIKNYLQNPLDDERIPQFDLMILKYQEQLQLISKQQQNLQDKQQDYEQQNPNQNQFQPQKYKNYQNPPQQNIQNIVFQPQYNKPRIKKISKIEEQNNFNEQQNIQQPFFYLVNGELIPKQLYDMRNS
ncbi:unnamed protein product [Paramecium sonneborni]|uniref:Uncharacterized protein n=1 Tax=Paramecium sonneborni TaxID=65129 RepID=A0A8S1QWL7_9CILI|nr:unnamed protein product [Paramecium sonneborni]